MEKISSEQSNVFHYNGHNLEVTDVMKNVYREDGFVLIKGLLSTTELGIVEDSLTGPESLTKYAYGNDDGQGREARMCLWNNAGNDTTGILARTEKLAGTAAKLLGDEVYHYHSKLLMKDAKSGGRFMWHQDYGYWYNFGCLKPDMLTVFVALDRCGKDNGCLQVLRGSHLCGRVDHKAVAGQVGADPERVAEIEKRSEKVFVEMSAGDALFFHCNLLHASNANDSDYRRWAILSCYNLRTNGPLEGGKVHIHHPPFSNLEIVDNEAVTRTGVSRDFKGKDVLVKKDGEFSVVVM